MNNERCWVVVPAAGVGRRMGGDIPKQYLELSGQAVLLHTLKRLASCPGISGLFLGVSADDPYWQKIWQEISLEAPWLKSVCDGGDERADTVSRILDDMTGMVQENDWVLVHDAVRPCISHTDIQQLMKLASQHDGGLLGRPISDTVKLTDHRDRVKKTIPRDGLWRAQTPQMFRYGQLRKALMDAKKKGLLITDEASAMELAGFQPLMVQGSTDNIKITVPGDLELAEVFINKKGLS
jgi:2-C-methyl-D-erythritol 4-phosphate cytidylyltransferase